LYLDAYERAVPNAPAALQAEIDALRREIGD
jgi:hypothetical protein